MTALTKIQADVYRYIKGYIAENGMPPTRPEISENFNWKSANAAQCHITALVKKGAITAKKGSGRSLVPVKGYRVKIMEAQ